VDSRAQAGRGREERREYDRRCYRQRPGREGYRGHALDVCRCQPVQVFVTLVGPSARDIEWLGRSTLPSRPAAVAAQAFISSNDPRFTRPLPVARHEEKVKTVNKAVVRQAREFVWGTDDDQLEFVRKHIRTVPDRVILSDAQRQQGIAAARGL
jgi:hypothetical protein